MKLSTEIIKKLIREELSALVSEQSPTKDDPAMQELAKVVVRAAIKVTKDIINSGEESTGDYKKIRDKEYKNLTAMIELNNLDLIMNSKPMKRYGGGATEDQVSYVIVNNMAPGIHSLGGKHVLLPKEFRQQGKL